VLTGKVLARQSVEGLTGRVSEPSDLPRMLDRSNALACCSTETVSDAKCWGSHALTPEPTACRHRQPRCFGEMHGAAHELVGGQVDDARVLLRDHEQRRSGRPVNDVKPGDRRRRGSRRLGVHQCAGEPVLLYAGVGPGRFGLPAINRLACYTAEVHQRIVCN